MDKKKRIAIISIVSVLCVSVVIWGILSQSKKENNDTNGNTSSDTNNESSIEKLVEDEEPSETESQVEPTQANGVNLEEFESKIKELGFTSFEEKSYDLFVADESIAFVEIEESGVKLYLNNKTNISNETIKSLIKSLLPNSVEELIGSIKEDTTELAISLDNRTVNIIVTEERLELFITK